MFPRESGDQATRKPLLVASGKALSPRERETRTLAYQGTVRMLALRLKNRLPPSIELNDCIQAGLIAVWTADPELPRSWMRKRIWWAMIDSFKGKEYREATRPGIDTDFDSPTNRLNYSRPSKQNPVCDPVREPKDLRPNVEEITVARDRTIARAAAQSAQASRVHRAVEDPDPLHFPLTRREKRVIKLRYTDAGMTQQATARRLHISQTRVSQLEARAIGRLRLKLAA